MMLTQASKALAAARAAAAQRDFSTFSDLPGTCRIASNLRETYMHHLTEKTHAAQVEGHPRFRWVGLDPSNNLTIFHSPTTHFVDGVTQLIAVEGDDLTPSHSVSLPQGAFTRVTVAIARQGDAKNLGWCELERLPLDCPNTQLSAQNTTADPPGPIPVTIRDLGFTSGTTSDGPIFVVLPTTYPLCPSEGFHLQGHLVTDPLPPNVAEKTEPGLLKWIACIRQTITANGAPCNSDAGTLFSPNDVTTFIPDTDDDGNTSTPPETSEYLRDLGARLATSFHTTAALVKEVPAIRATRDGTILMKLEPFMARTPATPPPTDTPITPEPSPRVDTTTAALIAALKTFRTPAKASDSPTTSKALLRYRTLFGHSEINNDGASVLKLATLTTSFEEVMKETNKTEQRKMFREAISGHQTRLVDKGEWGLNIDFDVHAMSDAFCTQFLTHTWITEPLSAYTGAMDESLTIFNFLKPKTDEAYWKAFVNRQATVTGDALHEPDTKKHAKKPRKLYTGGHMATTADLVTGLSNFLLFATFVAEDADDSPLVCILRDRIRHYQSAQVRKNLANIATQSPHLVHALLEDTQMYISHFISRLSGDPTLVIRLARGDTILAADTIAAADRNVKNLVQSQNSLCLMGTTDHYQRPRSSYSFLTGYRPPEDDPDLSWQATGQRASDSAAPTTSTPPPRKARSDPAKTTKSPPTSSGRLTLTEAQKDERRKQGYLKTKKGNFRKRLTHEFSTARTPNKQMCNGHAYVGAYCSQKVCNRWHVPLDWNKIPAVDQQALCAFVSDYPDLVEWAPGKAPRTTTSYDPFSVLLSPLPRPSSPLQADAVAIPTLPSAPPPEPTAHLYPAPHPIGATPVLARPSPLPPTPSPGGDLFLSAEPPHSFSESDLDDFAATLPPAVTTPLNNPYGKPHRNISFTGETRFRHIIPHLVTSTFLDAATAASLGAASFLVRQFQSLHREYSRVDSSAIRGYAMYKDSITETTLNTDRIRLSSAALLQQGCNLEKLVRHIGGPHLATHRNIKRILHKLRLSCTREQRAELRRIFTVGAPKLVHATNTEENLLKFYRYGNHSTVAQHPDIYRKVLVKDSRRGNVIILDDRLFPYIPHTHLTPQGLADIDNKWKKPRTIFDSSFRPDEYSMAINDWTNKRNEPDVTYPGSFTRFLVWLWNLRITYPTLPIFMGDDDVTNAFRLIKTNPCAVGMHMYRFDGHSIVATGQTFGDSFSPANFEPAAICRQFHARWLWEHRPSHVLDRARSHVTNIQLIHAPEDPRPFAPANADRFNRGVLNPDGSRRPPPYPMQVDDCLYADVAEFFPRTVASSVVALEDVFDGHHPYFEPPLSLEKLDPIHREQRILLGHYPDTRSMEVKLSPRRAEKILSVLEDDGWLRAGHSADIRSIAAVVGLIESACEFFPWGRSQLRVLYETLRTAIGQAYARSRRLSRIRHRVTRAHRTMPKDLAYRLRFLEQTWVAQALWREKTPIPIPDNARRGLVTIWKYIKSGSPWACPIGHIVPREPDFLSFSDASLKAIGISIPTIKAWCFLPYSPRLCARVAKGEVHINVLEFIGLLMAYIMVLESYNMAPHAYNPTPVMRAMGDNTSANAWWNKLNTHSMMGCNLLKLYAEYQLGAPVHARTEHIPGEQNIVADAISRLSTVQGKETLASFPPVSRTHITTELTAVLGINCGATKTSKELRTLRTRRLHFLRWLRDKRLFDSLFPVITPTIGTTQLNMILAMYAVSLANGHTISSRQIKASTIRTYLQAAATFLRLFDHHPQRDGRFSDGTNTICPSIQNILRRIERFESIPNRKEPYTLAMQKAFHATTAALAHSQPDCLQVALFQWFGVALQGGNRRSEWCQPPVNRDLHTYELNPLHQPRAFTLGDISFLTGQKHPLPVADALRAPSAVQFARVKYRWQKNDSHGEEKTYTRNGRNPACDSVGHLLNICARYLRLCGPSQPYLPLAVYRTSSGATQYITSADAVTRMRALAADVYAITSPRSLARWTCHSLRVGACCILWAHGLSGEFIQRALRWRSESWKDYIRDLTTQANQHNDAIADVWDMPRPLAHAPSSPHNLDHNQSPGLSHPLTMPTPPGTPSNASGPGWPLILATFTTIVGSLSPEQLQSFASLVANFSGRTTEAVTDNSDPSHPLPTAVPAPAVGPPAAPRPVLQGAVRDPPPAPHADSSDDLSDPQSEASADTVPTHARQFDRAKMFRRRSEFASSLRRDGTYPSANFPAWSWPLPLPPEATLYELYFYASCILTGSPLSRESLPTAPAHYSEVAVWASTHLHLRTSRLRDRSLEDIILGQNLGHHNGSCNAGAIKLIQLQFGRDPHTVRHWFLWVPFRSNRPPAGGFILPSATGYAYRTGQPLLDDFTEGRGQDAWGAKIASYCIRTSHRFNPGVTLKRVFVIHPLPPRTPRTSASRGRDDDRKPAADPNFRSPRKKPRRNR